MNISMQLAVVVAAACLCLSDAAPEARLARKSQRPTRGFKNIEMLTARGFGKRDHPPTRSEHGLRAIRSLVFEPKTSVLVGQRFGKRVEERIPNEDDFLEPMKNMVYRPRTSLMTSRGFGKRDGKNKEELGLDNFWTLLEAPEGEVLEGDGKLESIPTDWFVNEMLNNPDFARSVVRKFIDLNQDGMLSTDELLRNVD